MPTYKFEEITHPVTKRVACRFCGKKLTRSITLSQTVSPFNKDADGNLKSPDQIRAELKEQAAEWEPTNAIHAACIEAEQAAKASV